MAETCVEPPMTQIESASEVGDVNDVSEAEVSAEDRHWHLAHTASTCSGKAEIPTQKETSKDPNASSADGIVWDESRGKPAEATGRERHADLHGTAWTHMDTYFLALRLSLLCPVMRPLGVRAYGLR